MSLTLVQTATTTAAAPATATLGATPTPGNLLWVVVTKNDNPSATIPSVTIGGVALTNVGGTVRSHPTFGGMGWAYYRVVQPGDGTAVILGATSGNTAMRVTEFSGIAGTVPSTVVTGSDHSGTSLALFVSAAGSAVLAGFVTRLNSGGGSFTPNSDTTQVGSLIYPGGSFNGAQAVGYGTGSLTIGGTQGGSTQDGYWWGGIAAAFDVADLPVAAFTSDTGDVGETLTFTDTSTNTPTSWAWTFGDGGTSTSQNPTHVYATPGTFSVTLTVTNAFGSDSVTHSVTVRAAGTPEPPEPAGVLLEIYAHAPGAARWDVAKWDEAVWGTGGWRDVTPYGITVDIDWGSRRPELGILSTPDAASWNVEYYDPDRVLDPSNDAGPYFGDLIPFLPIRVSHRGTVVRRGYASVISHNYSDPGRGGMRGADNISVLANAMVPSDTTLSDTLYARAVDAIAAAGLSVTVAAPVGTDPPVSPWVTATREWSVWDWIKDAAQEVLHIPIIDRLGTLTFRPWASPLARGRVIGSPELIDLGVVTDWSGLFSVVTARLDVDTIETRALTPPPGYGARTYARDEITIDAGDWAATVLADRGLPTLLWKPGDMRPLTAVSTELLATIEAVELVSLQYPEANGTPISASGIVVGGSIHIEGKRDDSAIWRFHYELAQTATEPLIETGGDETDYLLRTGGGEYLYPTGSA